MVLSRYKALNRLAPDERAQAVYQHCCLRFVSNQITNNESIRERFKIEKQNSAQASRLLREALEAGRIKRSTRCGHQADALRTVLGLTCLTTKPIQPGVGT